MFGFTSKEQRKVKEDFMELLQGRTEVLYKIAFSYFKDKDKSLDIVQEAVLTAYKNINTLRDTERFNSWITSILVNKCKETLRKNRKILFTQYDETVVESGTPAQNENKAFTKVEDKLYVMNLLMRLNEKYSEVIKLKYLGDYSIAEIARVLKIPEGTVKSRLNTGIKQLKAFMEVNKDEV